MKKLILAAVVGSLFGCATFDLVALQQLDDNAHHAKYCKKDSDCDQGKHCALYGHTEGACMAKADAAQKK